jgi:hypothetical protein
MAWFGLLYMANPAALSELASSMSKWPVEAALRIAPLRRGVRAARTLNRLPFLGLIFGSQGVFSTGDAAHIFGSGSVVLAVPKPALPAPVLAAAAFSIPCTACTCSSGACARNSSCHSPCTGASGARARTAFLFVLGCCGFSCSQPCTYYCKTHSSSFATLAAAGRTPAPPLPSVYLPFAVANFARKDCNGLGAASTATSVCVGAGAGFARKGMCLLLRLPARLTAKPVVLRRSASIAACVCVLAGASFARKGMCC